VLLVASDAVDENLIDENLIAFVGDRVDEPDLFSRRFSSATRRLRKSTRAST
jgi:hypothetical protein